MRLIKMLAYATLGYALYQFIKGVGETNDTQDGNGYGRDMDRELSDDPARRMNITGTGSGTSMSTADSSGASIPHLVGRGVVQT